MLAQSLTSGYQDFKPTTESQLMVSLIIVFIGVFVYATIVGSVTTVLAEMNATGARHKQRMNSVTRYFRQQQVPLRVCKAVVDYFNFAGFGGADDILEGLPANLRLQLDLVMNRALFLKAQRPGLRVVHARCCTSSD